MIIYAISLMKKTKKIFNALGYLLALFLIVSTVFPQIFFKYKEEYKSFVVYSNTKNLKNIHTIIDEADKLLIESELYNNSYKQKIFICNNNILYTVFAISSRKAFAVNNTFTNNIFIANANLEKNISYSSAKENNVRTLNSVIAHETCHSFLKKKLGFVKYKFLARWKNEGYCDFIANESSFNYKRGLNLFCEENTKPNTLKSFEYFKYRLYVNYLIEYEQKNISEILQEDFEFDILDKKVNEKYCKSLNEQ